MNKITLANIQNKLEIHQMVQNAGRYNFVKIVVSKIMTKFTSFL